MKEKKEKKKEKKRPIVPREIEIHLNKKKTERQREKKKVIPHSRDIFIDLQLFMARCDPPEILPWTLMDPVGLWTEDLWLELMLG